MRASMTDGQGHLRKSLPRIGVGMPNEDSNISEGLERSSCFHSRLWRMGTSRLIRGVWVGLRGSDLEFGNEEKDIDDNHARQDQAARHGCGCRRAPPQMLAASQVRPLATSFEPSTPRSGISLPPTSTGTPASTYSRCCCSPHHLHPQF